MSGTDNDCGCCAGNSTETPEEVTNRPGLPAIAYRAGTWATFKQSLLARLSSSDFPKLSALGTRRDDDWTIGLCDAFSVMGDVLTFYQERIANEAFLRTSTERRSVLELSRLVGYQLAPGVAASTPLAFTLDVPLAPGSPPPLPVTVPPGTRTQSVPGPEELPQTFETIESIVARAEWNALGVQQAIAERPYLNQVVAWIEGTATQLSPGDMVAFISEARAADPANGVWEVAPLSRVDVYAALGLTRIEWPVARKFTQFAARGSAGNQGVRVYALRQRAGVFGHNAIDPNMINFTNFPTDQKNALVVGATTLSWKDYVASPIANTIDLDAVYPKVVPKSWAYLTSAPGTGRLYGIETVSSISRAKFGISAKVSRLVFDSNTSLDSFPIADTAVHAQSEELVLADRPLVHPVFGARLVLDSVQEFLARKQMLALTGKRPRVRAPARPNGIVFTATPARVALPHESFVVLAPPLKLVSGVPTPLEPEELDESSTLAGTLRWSLQDHDGATLSVDAPVGAFIWQAPADDDPAIAEVVTIADTVDAVTHDVDRSTLVLTARTIACFDRASLRINANVAAATHGEAVGEIAGSGEASLPDQRFRLKQAPLTYVPADNPRGSEATLAVRVNDLLWKEVPSLYAQPPTAHVYALRQDDGGNTIVQFGDGAEGGRLPTGTDNVRFAYRKGLGLAGNVRAGTLTSLLVRPLGVKSAVNPLPAAGGEDPETRATARRNAPNTVLTLDRAVSVLDYADFARAFAGIAKSVAAWIPSGAARGMHITIAGAGGAAITPDTRTWQSLHDALRGYGDELLPLTLQSFVAATFKLTARLKIAPEYPTEKVRTAVEQALRTDFAFDARDFGMPVTIDEVIASIHRVAGIVAVDIDALHRSELAPGSAPEARLFPSPGSVQADGSVTAAELLTLDPDGLSLGVLL